MGYYSLLLDMERRPVLLAGGGTAAAGKIGRLLDSGAAVTVFAPRLNPELREHVNAGRAKHVERRYREGDASGFSVVVIAGDDGADNSAIAEDARALGALVNAVDDPVNCDFILPAVSQRGHVTIAVSTAGTSPALTRWLREQMDAFLNDEVVALADLLAEVRIEARRRDHECAAGCDRTRSAPPLLCDRCPNRIDPERWQDAISEARDALQRGAREIASAQQRDGPLDGSLLALAGRGEYRQAREGLRHSLGLDRPLLSRAAR